MSGTTCRALQYPLVVEGRSKPSPPSLIKSTGKREGKCLTLQFSQKKEGEDRD